MALLKNEHKENERLSKEAAKAENERLIKELKETMLNDAVRIILPLLYSSLLLLPSIALFSTR